MRRFLCLLMTVILILTAVSCTSEPDETTGSTSETVIQNGFNPHIYSRLYEENFDDATKESFFSFCDAVLAGEEEFNCPDNVTFYNITTTISHQCMPLATYFIDMEASGVKGGKGHLVYTVPKEQYLVKVEEFKDIVTSMLEECIRPGYDDTDKALALYEFFASHYIYDYDADYDNSLRLSAYRLFYEQKGICQEIAPAYAYMLSQAGVDCTTCGSLNNLNEAHEWAVARLNGEYYHIDPTWAVTNQGTLRFFGMDDNKRMEEGAWEKALFNYGEANIFDTRGELSCDSLRFSPLWDSVSYSVNYEDRTVSYRTSGGEDKVFSYGI